MKDVFDAALQIQGFIQDRHWPFCIIGGLAVIPWGEPRYTGDVDITLLTGFGREAEYVDALVTRFNPRSDDAREFALKARVLLLVADNGVPLDIALAGFPYEEKVVQRAVVREIASGVRLKVATAEDVVVLKAFAGRDRDWGDVTGIVVAQGTKLDWEYIESELKLLCELREDSAALDRLRKVRDEAKEPR